ncbi:hypothetical protein TRAPUB_9864 [Trametes pubescens]|uniref:Uncharacterized protein n=1 Tax=Trametes pubescens TaxID=154538 RepID=A0A1M2W1B7_TRAPU|nr:hypothetical protein TRAPUB_9864 [Trametes pubescens]
MNLRDTDGKVTGTDTGTTGGAGALESWHVERGTAGAGTLVFTSNFVELLGGPLDRSDREPGNDSGLGMLSQDKVFVGGGEAKVAV